MSAGSNSWQTSDSESGEDAKKGVEVQEEEKPQIREYIFTYEFNDLKDVIEKVKAITTLKGLRPSHWTRETEEQIGLFFTDSRAELLTVFYNRSRLSAAVGEFPRVPVTDVMYFTKEPLKFVTCESFMRDVMFGTFSGGVEGAVLNVLERVFAPPLLATKNWPDSVKSDFCANMYHFLGDLTDLHHKLMGITILYVPSEPGQLSMHAALEDNELLKRLESLVVSWARQVRVALGDVDTVSLNADLFIPDVYDFWIYRYQNLSGIDCQLRNKNLKHILSILSAAQSTYLSQFFVLMDEIQDALAEAKSNIEFLQILNKPCEKLASLKQPAEIPEFLPSIIHLCRVIWVNSPFYNTSEHLSGLFMTLSNQIIHQCRQSVSLDSLFKGKTNLGIQQMEACISCLHKYKALFETMSEAHREAGQMSWELDRGLIFNRVDSFVQRCRDMVEVCNAMVVFGRMSDVEDIPAPMFGGTHGPEFEAICAKVEEQFAESLASIKKVEDIVLDVSVASWLDNILQFRNQMKDLEVIVENMVTALFEKVNTVEEGLQCLQALYYFYKRPMLRGVYDRYTAQVYKLFAEGVQDAKQDLVADADGHAACMPKFAGRALLITMKMRRLKRLAELFEAAEWLPYCGMGEEVMVQFGSLMRSMEDMVRDQHNRWLDGVAEDLTKRLDRPLMTRSAVNPGLLEVNLDRFLLEVEAEARYWKLLKFGIPRNVGRLLKKLQEARMLYESVLSVVMDYNRVITALSEDERVLFRELIKACNKKINPGLSKLQWNSDVSDAYIGDCLSHTTEIDAHRAWSRGRGRCEAGRAGAQLQEFVDDFKNSNLGIAKLCERICNTPLVHLDTSEPHELYDLSGILERYRERRLEDIINLFHDIFKFLILVYEGFEENLTAMGRHWANYILRMDDMVEEALRMCMRLSLSNLLTTLHGDGATGPSPLVNVVVTLENNKITFVPALSEVAQVIMDVLPSCLDLVAQLPRIYSKFHVPEEGRASFSTVVKEDEECCTLQDLISNELNVMVTQVHTYVKIWEPFRDIWDVSKDLFIARYEKLHPTVTAFDADISRYGEVVNNVQMIESLSFVQFLVINSNQLKSCITDHCQQWQDKLTDLLQRLAEDDIKGVFTTVDERTKRMQLEPQSLDELQESIALYRQYREEAPTMAETFPNIREQFLILDKYEVAVPPEDKLMLWKLDPTWEQYMELLNEAETMLERSKERFRVGLLDDTEVFKKTVRDVIKDFHKDGPFTSDWSSGQALDKLAELRQQLGNMRAKEGQLRSHLAIFGISLPDNVDLAALEEELDLLEMVWGLAKEWDDAWERYRYDAFWTLQTEEMEELAQSLFRKFTKLARELKEREWPFVEDYRRRLDEFRRTLPLIADLKNPAMRARHWSKVKEVVKQEFEEDSEEFTLDTVIQLDFQAFSEEISDISNSATMELQIEQGLKAIREFWEQQRLDMTPHKDRGAYKLKVPEEVFQALEDHQMSLAAMKATRFVDPFIKEVDYWERTLSVILEVLELVLHVQKLWLYLENIFTGEDIRRQLPKETDDFDKVSYHWEDITNHMNLEGTALLATSTPGLWKRLQALLDRLEAIQRGLEKYLETKRHTFPRFYFISNDDLLEILAQGRRPEMVQPHLKKCFDNLTRINIQKLGGPHTKPDAVGMYSAEGEYVEFGVPIALTGAVEIWLCDLEAKMRLTLRDQLRSCRAALRKNLSKRDKWIKEWPGQSCITASQIQWTTDCSRALTQAQMLETRSPLKRVRSKENKMLNKFSEAIRGQLTKLQRLKIVALVTIEIHARDVVDRMYRANCMTVTAFEWLAQLRFYWDRDVDDCIIRQTNTYFVYGYEYLGNSGRLVITPLTDRCYITLTTALHLNRGGSPKGPAGTGKTETVKDLGKSMGCYVIVLNCSEGLDYKSMGRMFSGLAQTGAWGCFDEFNRINIEVLSVVAQQILSILSALAAGLRLFVFEGSEIRLVHSCGIFITMNPGYAGRTELPDNLKSMFRPISMIVPDSALIAEIILFGEGFKEVRVLAKKVDTLYNLAKQQLSKQDHYDFGLRGLVSLLKYAGGKRRAFSHLPDDEVLLLAMKDMNEAKLTADDLPLFRGIVSDLFPGVEVPVIEYEELQAAVETVMRRANLQSIRVAITKVIQLYETKNSRHSVMIVGLTCSGKSVTWRTLQNAMTLLKSEGKEGYEVVREYPINPKALTLAELYGEFDLASGEWNDGVLSAIMRITCSEDTPDQKWILFDGPVDAVWIENMNSVMDDNKVLTLINSERITMPEQVSLLFEVEDLAVASPATVSRCGMVYTDYTDLGWWPYVDSWLHAFPVQPVAKLLREHFKNTATPLLQVKKQSCHDLVPVADVNLLISTCNLLQCLLTPENGVRPQEPAKMGTMTKLWFLFCAIWSIGATVTEEGRKTIDNYIRSVEGAFPLKDTVYDYYVDPRSGTFSSWEEKLSEAWHFDKDVPFFKLIVPTVDTARYKFLVHELLMKEYPCLLLGPVGTGKTSTAQAVLDSLDPRKYAVLVMNLSAQTSAANAQDIIESRVEKRTKSTWVPPGDKKMILFADDFNMPAKEVFGAQPPLELIRQWIDYGFWYDRHRQLRKYVKETILMASMGPPGGGRNFISNRLMSRFNVINMPFPSETQITRIFGTMLAQQLAEFDADAKQAGPKITTATIDLYNAVVKRMLPTPAKIHYMFNLRDISRVFQGLLRSNSELQKTKDKLLRLWVHECFRVFWDRLINTADQEWLMNAVSEQLATHFESTFHSICPEKESPVFGDFISPYGLYEDLVDRAALRKHLEGQLSEYNESPGVVHMDLVLFKDAILHITRMVRVVSQPRGNILLIGMGGSGRQSLARIAAYICEYHIFTIEVTKVYRVLEFKDDLKKLYNSVGVDIKNNLFIFRDTQVMDEEFLEIINNMLNSGEVPNLYKPEEFEEVKSSLQPMMEKKHIAVTTENILNFFLDRVRTCLHIALCMSPVGEAFRNRMRQYPALVNCTTIDWFHDWPKEALLEVADKYLRDINFIEVISDKEAKNKMQEMADEEQQVRLHEAIATIFAAVHASVSQASITMLQKIKRYNYVTPVNYLELVAGYKAMLTEKRSSVKFSANKLRNGLFKIDETRSKVEVMSVELQEAQVQVAEFQQQCDEYLAIIKVQTLEADEQQKTVAAGKIRTLEEERTCKKLAAVAQADLDEAMPALEEAMRALDSLNKRDMTEVKSYGRPPPKVEMVLEAVMILKGAEPTWAEAKRQLGESTFLNQLREFDKDNVSDKTLKKIGGYTQNPDFVAEKVGIVSLAAKSLCIWVRAIEKYAKVYRVVKPKKDKLDEATAELEKKQKALAEAEAKLKELSDTLARLQKEYEEKLARKEELRKKAEELMQKLERASALVEGLSGERQRWEETVKQMETQFDGLPGDCLLATGFLSYMGPFVSAFREQLLTTWKKRVKEEDVPHTAAFSLATFLTDPTTTREWNIQGLPSDEFSTENGIIVTRCTRWPLLIDPQCQGMKWIKNMEKDNELSVIDCGQADFMKTLEHAIQFGKPVLLQNVVEVLDPSIQPVLDRAIVKQGGQDLIKLSDKFVEYNYEFRFFITTKLGNPHYPPEICTKTTLVNFAVKEEGLEAQLLGIVVRKEKPELEELKDKLVLNIAAGRRTLMDLEDELLRLLYEAKGSLLDDLQLLITLQTSQSTSVAVTQQLKESETTEVEIDLAREGYRPCAKRASILFFVLTDMSLIDPMYQFSLDVYVNLFLASIERSAKAANLDERIVQLNEYHTYSVYKNTCRGLFAHHKLLFSFHMTIKILEGMGKMNRAEYLFLLKGGVVLDRANQRDNPCIGWLSETAWDNITELDKLAGFHGVIDTFEESPKDWQLWYTNKEPEEQPLMGEWEEVCTRFQKMLFVRSLRPDRMSFCVTAFIVTNLGQRFVEPPVLDVRSVLEDSDPNTPLIFVLSPGVDPAASLVQLAESVGMGNKLQTLSLGQGQAPVATRLVKVGAHEGHWVFLANCHLSLSWMPMLDKIVELLQATFVHPQFRLWLSSSPSPEFPLSILQSGIKMTTEPPKGLKANLKRLYHLITEERFTVCTQRSKYSRLLFSLCFFHTILLERKKFQQLGWNVVYSFNDSDFEVSENLLAIYLDEYPETPWDALKYLIAGINYGGHVTDDWDRRLLTTYINQYFCEEVLTTNLYRLSSLPTYHTPRDGSLESYQDFVAMMPNVDHPEAFGQHSNADITSLISETQSLFDTLMALQGEGEAAADASHETKVLQLAADVLNKIPRPINYESTSKLIGPTKTPLDVVLLQEISRYNILLVQMRGSLMQLQKGIKGLVVMSSELEEIFTCFFEGRVPAVWLKAFPSLKLLGAWTRDLVRRVEHFNTWATTTHPPVLFWLSAYTFPTGLLTAVLQTTARRAEISIDLLSWDFIVFQVDEYAQLDPPEDGVFVKGIYLEGAGWDRKNMRLTEPQPMQLVCPMPLIHFKPVEQHKKKTKGTYSCPCYYYPIRCGTTDRPSYIVAVDLKCGNEGADHWIKRGTALLLSLST